jgi:hypothetical protein
MANRKIKIGDSVLYYSELKGSHSFGYVIEIESIESKHYKVAWMDSSRPSREYESNIELYRQNFLDLKKTL